MSKGVTSTPLEMGRSRYPIFGTSVGVREKKKVRDINKKVF